MRINKIFGATLLLGVVPSAWAATTVYSDQATWLSNTASQFTYAGPTVAAGGFINYNTASGLIIPQLQITGRQDAAWVLTAVNAATNGSQPWYQWNSGTIFRSEDKTPTSSVYLTVNFAAPVSAFAFNYGAGGSSGAPAIVTISPQGYSSLTTNTLQQPTFGFYGIVSDSQVFSSVNIYINDTNRYLILDNISTATATEPPPPPGEVPELASFLYLLTGLGLTAYGMRRRGRDAAQMAS